jgi:hypothetical protein
MTPIVIKKMIEYLHKMWCIEQFLAPVVDRAKVYYFELLSVLRFVGYLLVMFSGWVTTKFAS